MYELQADIDKKKQGQTSFFPNESLWNGKGLLVSLLGFDKILATVIKIVWNQSAQMCCFVWSVELQTDIDKKKRGQTSLFLKENLWNGEGLLVSCWVLTRFFSHT